MLVNPLQHLHRLHNLLPLKPKMTDWDKDNLKFIMETNDGAFDVWLDQADDRDIEYALELIRMARVELMVQEMEITDSVSNFTEANLLIERIKSV